MTDPKRWNWWPKITRDGLLFVLGCGLLIRESFRGGDTSAALITASVTLLLSPAAIRLDERRRGSNARSESQTTTDSPSGS